MTHPYRLDLPVRPGGRLGAWTGALLMHGAAGLALLLAWPEAGAMLERALPVEVRMLTPEPERPLPPPPKRPPPPPQAAPQPLAPPVPTPPAPVLATSAPTVTAMAVPPAPPAPAPVAVAEPARPAPPAPPAPPEPLVEARFDADYLSNPRPVYPMASRRLGEAGVVHLRVHVGPEGQALKVELKTSSGFSRLDQSALDTVARWHFVPARRGATPVASWVVVPIIFSLT